VDPASHRVFVVNRDTNLVFVYQWDAATRSLALLETATLPGVSMAAGLAYDEATGWLFVADAASTTVRYYQTADWSLAGSFVVSQPPMGIAVDGRRGYVYTGNAFVPSGQPALLSQYDLATGSERLTDLRALTGDAADCVVGIAADPDTGLVYITTGNQVYGGTSRLMVFDTALTWLYSSPYLGNPTGLCIPASDLAYNPLHLANDDGVPANASAPPGGLITYTLSYDNLASAAPATGVVLTDTLSPQTVFVSASPGGVYDPAAHAVTWDIGTLPAFAPRASQTVTAQVKAATPEGTLLANRCQITSAETGPAFATALTPVGGANRPPTADAGPDQTVEQDSPAGATVTLDASASSDPDGDSLTCLWSWAGRQETGTQLTATFPLGTTTVTLVCGDGKALSEPDTVTVTVRDTTPPTLVAPADIVAEQASRDGTAVDIGQPLAADACDAQPVVTSDAPAVFPLGETIVTWTATDASGNVATATQKVTIVDTAPPEIESAWATPSTLWPPNHRMVPVVVGLAARDACDAQPQWKIVAVASNQPHKGRGCKKTRADWQITGDHTVNLRAERYGWSREGRTYTITLQVADASGNTATTHLTVAVAHDQRKCGGHWSAWRWLGRLFARLFRPPCACPR